MTPTGIWVKWLNHIKSPSIVKHCLLYSMKYLYCSWLNPPFSPWFIGELPSVPMIFSIFFQIWHPHSTTSFRWWNSSVTLLQVQMKALEQGVTDASAENLRKVGFPEKMPEPKGGVRLELGGWRFTARSSTWPCWVHWFPCFSEDHEASEMNPTWFVLGGNGAREVLSEGTCCRNWQGRCYCHHSPLRTPLIPGFLRCGTWRLGLLVTPKFSLARFCCLKPSFFAPRIPARMCIPFGKWFTDQWG